MITTLLKLCKQTNKMHFLYVFILHFLYNSTCFERPFRSSSGVHDLLYSAALYKPCRNFKLLLLIYIDKCQHNTDKLYKQTNKVHFLQCQHLSICIYVRAIILTFLHSLYRELQNTVSYKPLWLKEMVVRNMQSCTKIVE